MGYAIRYERMGEIVKELLVRNMQDVAKLNVILRADAGIGKTWYDAH